MSSSTLIPAKAYWVFITHQAMHKHFIYMSSLPREKVEKINDAW